MSRKDRKHVWTQYAGESECIICPSCRKVKIKKDGGGKNGQVEHIIKLSYGGPDS